MAGNKLSKKIKKGGNTFGNVMFGLEPKKKRTAGRIVPNAQSSTDKIKVFSQVHISEVDSIPQPTFSGKWTGEEIKNVIKSKDVFKETTVVYLDQNYTTYSLDDLKVFLKETPIDLIEYRQDAFDCDDFSKVLSAFESLWLRKSCPNDCGTLFGTIYGDIRLKDPQKSHYHMMNIFMDSKQDVYLIEPQTDQIYALSALFGTSNIVSITF